MDVLLLTSCRKHRLKHEKPFKCPILDCERAVEGFTTGNDLERHKKSKHRIFPSNRPVKCYKCASDTCTDKSKIWPRLDNFCQHLDRMHPGENKDEIIKKCVAETALSSASLRDLGEANDICSSEYMHSPDDGIEQQATSLDDDEPNDLPDNSTHDAFGFMGNQFTSYTQDDQSYDQTLNLDQTLDPGVSPSAPNYGTFLPPTTEANWPSVQSIISPASLPPSVANDTMLPPQPYIETFPGGQPTLMVYPSQPFDAASEADKFIDTAVSQGVDRQSLLDAVNRRFDGEHRQRSGSMIHHETPMSSYDTTYDTSQYTHATNPQQQPISGGATLPTLRSMSAALIPSSSYPMPASYTPPHMPSPAVENGLEQEIDVNGFKCKYCPKVLLRLSALK